jgi:plastocyanin
MIRLAAPRLARALAFLTLAAATFGAPDAHAVPGPTAVTITQFKFETAEVTIDAGAAIQWTNRDQTIHNIVSKDGKFASPGLDTGDTWTYTFAQPGDYPYFCALHPHMTGIIHVRAHA